MKKLFITFSLIISPLFIFSQVNKLCTDSINIIYPKIESYNERIDFLILKYEQHELVADSLLAVVIDIVEYTGIDSSISLGYGGAYYKTDELFYKDIKKWRDYLNKLDDK